MVQSGEAVMEQGGVMVKRKIEVNDVAAPVTAAHADLSHWWRDEGKAENGERERIKVKNPQRKWWMSGCRVGGTKTHRETAATPIG